VTAPCLSLLLPTASPPLSLRAHIPYPSCSLRLVPPGGPASTFTCCSHFSFHTSHHYAAQAQNTTGKEPATLGAHCLCILRAPFPA